MKPKLYVFTNGYPGTWASIEYACWIAQTMGTDLTLIGAIEDNKNVSEVEDIFSRAVSLFQEKSVEYRLELKHTSPEEAIHACDQANPARLLIFGPFGHSKIRRMLVGRSFRHILAEITSPMIYVQQARIPIQKVLICLGGLSYATTMENIGIRVASMTGSSVTFLTVVPPIGMDYPETRKMRENWQHLADTDTISGRALRQAIETAQAAGLPATVKTRNGNVVEEILAEIAETPYDLVCMGSPYSSHSLRHLYAPNVTADVAETIHIPLLTARYVAENTPT